LNFHYPWSAPEKSTHMIQIAMDAYILFHFAALCYIIVSTFNSFLFFKAAQLRKGKLVRLVICLLSGILCLLPLACAGEPRQIYITDQPGYTQSLPNTIASPAAPPTAKAQPAVPPISTGTPQPVPAAEKTFVGSKSSNKYHRPSCEWAQKIASSNQVWFASSEAAQAKSYVACKVCKPP
jgi:hypothetical protein